MTYLIKYNFVIHFLLIYGSISGQEVISLKKAMEIASINNSKLRSGALLVKYQHALVNTAYNISPTQINTELGQFNSSYFDTGFGISQSFSLPQVYRHRAAANQQQAKSAEYNLRYSEAEIRQQVDQIFMEYYYLLAKENLLKLQDSLYTTFVEKTYLRWQKGETDILEKTTAEQQKINISNQLTMVDKMKGFTVVNLEWLLNDGKRYLPKTQKFDVLKYGIFYDSLSILKHPVIQFAGQEIETARAMTQAEKTALLPELTGGYRNVSIRGIGADNVVYQGGDRFSIFQVGIGFPIFRKGIRAAIQSAQMMEEVKTSVYTSKKAEIQAQIRQKYLLYDEITTQLGQYELKALPNARLIRSVTEKQFSNGQINYLEYVMLSNQALATESEYLDLKRNLNTIIIDLHYLTNNDERSE